ncbi:MAG: type II toxin-antitoxin system HicB family antitoxin [Deltaproteobacteria bacterium]|nr:type II toxin-antitoxin system HicB family antitoxin [Deltaproteobacteria bacterium]
MAKINETNKLNYNGYTGSIEISFDDNCLHGKILFINDLITYEGSTPEDLSVSFESAVDRYIAYCNNTGKPANKPYSGTFNIRIGRDLHRKAASEAYARNLSLNDYVAQAIKSAIDLNGT